MIVIREIPETFDGLGEVNTYSFRRVKKSEKGNAIYEVTSKDGGDYKHYEVIKREIVPICIDFENRIYSDVDFKEVYPKSTKFGELGWTFKTLKEAENKLKEIDELS